MLKLLAALLFLSSCGKDSPFSQKYWDNPGSNQQQENTTGQSVNRSYSATIHTISNNVGQISGTVSVAVTNNGVTTKSDLTDVPQILKVGERSLSALTCEQIASTYPPPVIVTGVTEFRNVSTTETQTRESLITELNQVDPQNSGSLDLTGRAFVVKAYAQNVNSPVPSSSSLIPVACGILQVQAQPTTTGTSGGTSSGSTAGGTTGGVSGTTIGGVSNSGAVGGSIGGTIGTSTIGAIGGTVSGSIGGSVDGTVGGGVNGTINGGVVGSVGGGFNGSIGGGTGSVGGGISGTFGGTVSGTTGF